MYQVCLFCALLLSTVLGHVIYSLLMSYNLAWSEAENPGQESPSMRRLVLFLRTFRKARKLGFGLVDAMRAARVNSYV